MIRPNSVCERLSPGDPSSYSRPDQAILTNILLSLDANFERKIFSGNVDLSVKKINENVNELILDTKDLNIDSIFEKETGRKLNFTISNAIAEFGSKLTVELPPDAATEFVICINYATSPNASGLQWLKPEQTAGKQYPYVFSQFQAIAARSFLPCQDTPFVKTKYQAVISVPDGLTAVMSAICDSSTSLAGRDSAKHQFHFVQDIPIPAYLIAIAIGALESRDIGPRSKVWAEKEVVDAAAYEFANIEDQLRTAEEICGPYIWGRYNLLVLPSSYAFGGMANPCLTFISPTLLAGDRSLAYAVAHEIAHSWSGNLVTNANFEHLWLNEGFAVLIERKIVGRLENQHLQDFQAYNGLQNLKYIINGFGENHNLTKLIIDLTSIHPDEALSVVRYEKGQLFLRYLERIVGGPEHFEPFLRKYFDTFKYKSITTDTFCNFFEANFADIEAIKNVDWQKWLYSPGLPPEIPEFDMTYVKVCDDFNKLFIEWDGVSPIPFTDDDVKSLRTEQLIYLLQKIIMAEEPQSIDKLRQFEEKFKIESVTNAEIKYRWLMIGVQAWWEDKIKESLDWLVQVGRMKYVRCLYSALYGGIMFGQSAIGSNRNNH